MRSAQTCPPFTGFTQLAHPSRCSRSTLTTVCFCALVFRDHIASLSFSGLQPFTRCQCASFAVLLPLDPSKNSPSNCHFVFQSSLEFPDPCIWISRIVQFDLLSPLRRTPLLQRSMQSSSEALIQISQYGYRSEPPIPSCSSSRLGRQQSRCPRRL